MDDGARATPAGDTHTTVRPDQPERRRSITDADTLAAWRAFYPGWRDPIKPTTSYDATMDMVTLAGLRRVLEDYENRRAAGEDQ